MKPRWIASILVFLVLYTAIHYYIGWHGQLFLEYLLPAFSPVVYWILFGVVAFAYLLARLTERWIPGFLYFLLKVIGSYWLAVLMYAVLLLPLADLAAVLLHFSGLSSTVYIPLLGWTVLALLAIMLAVGSWNAWNPVVRKYEVALAKSAGGLDQLRIGIASDIHLGTIVRKTYLQQLIDRMDKLQPDLILLPGDIIDDDIKPFITQNMAETMSKLKAPLGVYAILGNHEYIGGHAEEFAERMKEIGIPVLMDQSVRINDHLYVVGRKDRTAERSDPQGRQNLEELLADVDTSLPVIVMDHQPFHLDKAADAGVDIMLSGHTHRGQMTPNHWITRRLFELDWGYLKKKSLHAIVSSGFGTWGPPIRIGSRSEIIELTVRFNDSSG